MNFQNFRIAQSYCPFGCKADAAGTYARLKQRAVIDWVRVRECTRCGTVVLTSITSRMQKRYRDFVRSLSDDELTMYATEAAEEARER